MQEITERNQSSIVIYRAQDGQLAIDVKLENETVWLTQEQMAELFDKARNTITEHINNIFKEGELPENLVCRFFRRTANDGKVYEVKYYNLDVIISVGYRVKSQRGTQFRIWATKVLKEHLVKGFTVNQKRLQDIGLREFEKTLDLIKNVIASNHRIIFIYFIFGQK